MKPLTQKELKACVRLLKRARKLIESEEEHFLCWAITESEKSGRDSILGRYLRDWIHSMLNKNKKRGCVSIETLNAWVMRKDSKTYLKFLKSSIETRLAWVDWMIAELNKEMK